MILIINAGSSSIKFCLYERHKKYDYTVIAKGLLERIGLPNAAFNIWYKGQKQKIVLELRDHAAGAKYLLNYLLEHKIIADHNDVVGLGHRIVNGGEQFLQSTLITPEIFSVLKKNIDLAPLHNPPAIATINAFQSIINCPAVAICDTSFHSTIPEENYLYPVPYEWYENYQVRRYGMHGISYRYIVKRLGEILHKPTAKLNAIICHLGNGASVCGVKNGASVITSMGLTPLEGLMMGTRSGDVDPSMAEYVCDKLNITYHDFVQKLNKESGLMAISGFSSDMRDIEEAAFAQNKPKAMLAIKMFVNRVCKYISYYQNEVGKDLDAVVFTGGIGENAVTVRKLVAEKLVTLDLKIDKKANEADYDDFKILSSSDSEAAVYAIHTNEELMMCRDVDDIILR